MYISMYIYICIYIYLSISIYIDHGLQIDQSYIHTSNRAMIHMVWTFLSEQLFVETFVSASHLPFCHTRIFLHLAPPHLQYSMYSKYGLHKGHFFCSNQLSLPMEHQVAGIICGISMVFMKFSRWWLAGW